MTTAWKKWKKVTFLSKLKLHLGWKIHEPGESFTVSEQMAFELKKLPFYKKWQIVEVESTKKQEKPAKK